MRTVRGIKLYTAFCLVLLSMLFLSTKSYSSVTADTNSVSYFPMEVGNVYIYSYTHSRPIPLPDTTEKLRAKISKDTLINSRRYFFLSNFPMFSDGWYRVDSTTYSLYKYDTTISCPNYFKETFQDSLAALPGDSSVGCGVPIKYMCTSISVDTIFSTDTFQKRFYFEAFIFNHTIIFTKKLGVRSYSYSSIGPGGLWHSTVYSLTGCTVNNITYGDTTFFPPPQFTQLNLVFPEPWSVISTSNYDTTKIIFSWSSSVSVGVKYKWKIKKSLGGSYIYFNSDSSGYARKFTIQKSKLDSLANSLGLIGDSVQCAWSCSARLGTDSAIGEVRVITIKVNTVGISNLSSVLSSEFKLYNNYPNPFNPETNIEFAVSSKSNVKLIIYDALGKKLAVLVNENLNAGNYNYKWDAANFPSGIYFYKLETENFTDTKRMILLK